MDQVQSTKSEAASLPAGSQDAIRSETEKRWEKSYQGKRAVTLITYSPFADPRSVNESPYKLSTFAKLDVSIVDRAGLRLAHPVFQAKATQVEADIQRIAASSTQGSSCPSLTSGIRDDLWRRHIENMPVGTHAFDYVSLDQATDTKEFLCAKGLIEL